MWVADGLFGDSFVEVVHQMLAGLPYYRLDRDTPESERVHLFHHWTPEEVKAHPIVGALIRPIDEAIGRLYGNFQPVLEEAYAIDSVFGDVHTSHFDRKCGVSALYYANRSWEREWHGETMFYDEADEAVAAVAPRPGRVAIFPADIRHRSGSQSRSCMASRRVVAFKYGTEARVP